MTAVPSGAMRVSTAIDTTYAKRVDLPSVIYLIQRDTIYLIQRDTFYLIQRDTIYLIQRDTISLKTP